MAGDMSATVSSLSLHQECQFRAALLKLGGRSPLRVQETWEGGILGRGRILHLMGLGAFTFPQQEISILANCCAVYELYRETGDV